jgi:branched-subunit amino acid transport protein
MQAMRLLALLRDDEVRCGARDMFPVSPGIAAWGLVTGVAMVKSGLALPLAVRMSLVVYPASSQFAALPLLAAGLGRLRSSLVRVLGLAVVTIVTRGLFPDRELPLPAWLMRGLKVAPPAVLAAVIVPEFILSNGQLPATWQDARWPAVAAASLWYVWRPGVLGPLNAGLAIFLPLHLAWGW